MINAVQTDGATRFPKKLLKAGNDIAKVIPLVHLTYVSVNDQGIERRKAGKHFNYYYKDKKITDKKTLERIKKLVLPPAWQQVWICRQSNGHIQATGIDARGRKQYRYHALWSELREHSKFYRMIAFSKVLPLIRETVQQHLRQHGVNREKVLAAIVSLMEQTSIRIGNSFYEQLYGSFGLSTLRNKHVQLTAATIHFVFKGKKGVYQDISLRDRKLATVIRACKEIPGKELFQYRDEDGTIHAVDSGMVNQYIRDISNGDFSSKDFRTWNGSVNFIKAFLKAAAETEGAISIPGLLDEVARHLGNTRNVCKKHYVHPLLLQMAEDKVLEKHCSGCGTEIPGLLKEENILVHVLGKGWREKQ